VVNKNPNIRPVEALPFKVLLGQVVWGNACDVHESGRCVGRDLQVEVSCCMVCSLENGIELSMRRYGLSIEKMFVGCGTCSYQRTKRAGN
jgi:hypothetical protein